MNNKTKITIILTLTGLVLLLVLLLKGGSSPNDKKVNPNKVNFVSSNWDNSFELVSKDPNGLYFMNYFIKAGLKKGQEVAAINHPYSLDTISRKTKPTFIFIGDDFVFDDPEIDSLLSRVQNGSKVFLAQHTLDEKIYRRLFDNVELTYDYGPSIKVKTKQNAYTFYHIFQSDTLANQWKGYRDILLNGPKLHTVLSELSGLENSISIPYGKGFIYLCTTPELFLNYQLKSKNGFYYSRTWLNRIPENENVYWLELGRFKRDSNEAVDETDDGSDKRDDSYLQFIFQKKQLVYAMILSLLGIILFLLFRSKRTQPAVPIIEPKKNMSLEFADTITSIYFNNRNPYVLLNIQKKNFYEAIQKHFFIDLTKRNEDKELNALAQKSTISLTKIKELVDGFETTEVSAVNEEYLLVQSKKYLAFYKESGMISAKVQSKLNEVSFQLYRSFVLSSMLLLFGLFTVVVGFYFLVQAIGVGVLLWPIGALLIAIALLRLSKPFISVNQLTNNAGTISHFPLFGKEKKFDLEKLIQIDSHPSGATFIFHGGKQLTVSYSELTKLDAQQLKQFVVIQNKLKL